VSFLITELRINKVEAVRNSDKDILGLNINIGIDNVKVEGQEVKIDFTYTATYLEGVGELKMNGNIVAKEDSKLVKEISDKWGKEKKLPENFAENVLNAINYACGTNGTLVVRAINLSPPILPPKIVLGGSEIGKIVPTKKS